ncbi:MAG TPA: M13 family metallopeptidase, partial [Rhizomicrobium sp.]|nr:M13 family metallopeptidase [Rhizomicrobium sp.]
FYTENLFGLWVAPDMNVPARNTAYLMQGGLGLPDREYYLADTDKMKTLRDAYRTHIAAMFALAGIADGPAKADAILALETAIAKVQASRVDNNDVRKSNNPWTRADFAVKAPGFDWPVFFTGAHLDDQQNFIVWQPDAFTGIAALAKDTPLDTWKDYLTFHLINHAAPYLSKAFVEQRFGMYGKSLSGAEVITARWKRAVDTTNAAMGDAVGKLYTAAYFQPAAKARLVTMVENIKTAFAHRIDALDWMSPATKAKAKEKLATLYVGVGYPETWRDYSGLEVERDDLLGNVMRAERWEYKRSLAKLKAPVDHTEWCMTPQTVNAVNLPLQNALNFPAGYLQPPFFDPDADDAFNYGAIGATIGHEISHSFDDQGALFDARGALANWWTPEDLAHFEASGEALAKQYDAYCPFADLCLNGRQTLSENIADVAGVTASFDAWQALHEEGPAPGGITMAQEFFLNYAQRSRTKTRENALRQQILTDGHSPGMYRSQAVRNVDGWYTAFDVKPGEKLYLAPNARVKVW